MSVRITNHAPPPRYRLIRENILSLNQRGIAMGRIETALTHGRIGWSWYLRIHGIAILRIERWKPARW